MDGQKLDGQTERQMYRWMDRNYMDGWVDGWTDSWMDSLAGKSNLTKVNFYQYSYKVTSIHNFYHMSISTTYRAYGFTTKSCGG